jgi:hypothetical protein
VISHPFTAPILSKLKHIALLDSSMASLQYPSQRTTSSGYKGHNIQLYEYHILKPLPITLNRTFDSISLFDVLHRLPGTFPLKTAHIATILLPVLVAGPDSTLYGTTVLGRGVRHSWIGAYLLSRYTRSGLWSKYGDDADGLKAGFMSYFEEVEVEVVGTTALVV